MERDAGRPAGSASRRRLRWRDVPLSRWRNIGRTLRSEIRNDNASIIAGGVAFYAFLALIPALFALVSIYGFFGDPAGIREQVRALLSALPAQSADLIAQEVSRAIAGSPRALSLGAIAGVLFGLWSAHKGTKALLSAVRIAYDVKERPSFVRLNATSLLFTLAGIVAGAVAVGLVVVLPLLFGPLGLESTARDLISIFRWPVLFVAILVGIDLLYRIGQNGRGHRWRLPSVGAVAAAVLWLGVTWLFSVYVANFSSYGKVYGSISAVVVLLMWLFVSAYAIIAGAELNASVEREIRRRAAER